MWFKITTVTGPTMILTIIFDESEVPMHHNATN
jgi:hypothetical protein